MLPSESSNSRRIATRDRRQSLWARNRAPSELTDRGRSALSPLLREWRVIWTGGDKL